ncbi:hypothetical protein GGE46_003303 [Rhizobium etli]|uniref:Uncharacterized protein n=1 Tax=Rhizobium etli TaxID=29449 RepID=A0A7W6Y876_RHIET|nr:hypothetical protein [Rhizobium etli]
MFANKRRTPTLYRSLLSRGGSTLFYQADIVRLMILR